MRDEEPHDLDGGEARVAEPREDRVCGVRREGDEVVGRRLGVVGPPGVEGELRAPVAVRDPDCAGELDASIFQGNIRMSVRGRGGDRRERRLTSRRRRRCV